MRIINILLTIILMWCSENERWLLPLLYIFTGVVGSVIVIIFAAYFIEWSSNEIKEMILK